MYMATSEGYSHEDVYRSILAGIGGSPAVVAEDPMSMSSMKRRTTEARRDLYFGSVEGSEVIACWVKGHIESVMEIDAGLCQARLAAPIFVVNGMLPYYRSHSMFQRTCRVRAVSFCSYRSCSR